MKAISLWQPWAKLVAVGAKTIETRGWSTSYRGPLAIHAAKTWNSELNALRLSEPFWPALQKGGWERFNELPRGGVVATCRLAACLYISANGMGPSTGYVRLPGEPERSFGNYAPGRYAWMLEDVVALPAMVPFRGAQGFFDVPDDLLKGGSL